MTIISYQLLAMSFFEGCAKEETTKIETASNASSQNTVANDEVMLNNEFSQAVDEAIQVICNHKAIIKGASVDTSQITINVITIYYGGNEAGGTKSRSGSDSIHLIGNWGTPGAIAHITMGCLNSPGYEVTYTKLTEVSVRLNGTVMLTNISGGYFQNISQGDSLVVNVKGSLMYTFNDQAATVTYFPFNVNLRRTISMKNSTLYATTEGDTAMNGFTNVSDWGTNRYQKNYYTSITTPVVQNITDYTLSYNPLSGIKDIQNIAEPILCTYGVNSAGNAITSGTPYGVYVSWTNNGGAAESVVPYYY